MPYDHKSQSLFSYILNYYLFSLFFKQEMELSLVGLQNAGKTSLVNAIAVSLIQKIFFYFVNFI